MARNVLVPLGTGAAIATAQDAGFSAKQGRGQAAGDRPAMGRLFGWIAVCARPPVMIAIASEVGAIVALVANRPSEAS